MFRGPTRTMVILTLIFPISYLTFMTFVFGAVNFNYPAALVIPDYATKDDLSEALAENKLPNTQEFIDFLNNNDLVGETLVKSHIVDVDVSEEVYESEMINQNIVMTIVLPENFEQTIAQVKNGNWSDGKIEIKLICLNIHEDYLKNIYFGFQRKLKAYYDQVLKNETEVIYIYSNADPNRITFPRMWTIGSGAIVFVCLTSSIIVAAAFIFSEKSSKMRPELALARPENQIATLFGKVVSSTIVSFLFNFLIGASIIFFWLGIPFPADLIGFLGIVIATLFLGSIIGCMLGCVIPEQVYTFPISLFVVLATLFLCGGFIDVEMFTSPLKYIVQLVPFTYMYVVTFDTILTGEPISLFHILGFTIYTIIFLGISVKVYKKYLISKT